MLWALWRSCLSSDISDDWGGQGREDLVRGQGREGGRQSNWWNNVEDSDDAWLSRCMLCLQMTVVMMVALLAIVVILMFQSLHCVVCAMSLLPLLCSALLCLHSPCCYSNIHATIKWMLPLASSQPSSTSALKPAHSSLPASPSIAPFIGLGSALTQSDPLTFRTSHPRLVPHIHNVQWAPTVACFDSYFQLLSHLHPSYSCRHATGTAPVAALQRSVGCTTATVASTPWLRQSDQASIA